MTFDYSKIGIATDKTVAEAAAKKKSVGLTQEDFFKLLTQEMKVQDPSKTQDASKILDQMSQMQSIQTMQQMTDSFKTMMDAMTAGQAMQASSMVGHSVMAAGNSGALPSGGEMRSQIVLPDYTDMLKVTITDQKGSVVDVVNMGSQEAGKADFTWSGHKADGTQVPPGVYKIKAEALVDGKSVELDVRTLAKVSSVNIDDKGVALNLLDGRQISLKDVNEIY